MTLFVLLCIGMLLYVGQASLAYYLFGSLLAFALVYFGSLLWAFRTYRNWLANLATHVSTTQTLPR